MLSSTRSKGEIRNSTQIQMRKTQMAKMGLFQNYGWVLWVGWSICSTRACSGCSRLPAMRLFDGARGVQNWLPSVRPELVEGSLSRGPFMVRQAHHERYHAFTVNGVTGLIQDWVLWDQTELVWSAFGWSSEPMGSSTIKVVPSPELLLAYRFPPCSWTIP